MKGILIAILVQELRQKKYLLLHDRFRKCRDVNWWIVNKQILPSCGVSTGIFSSSNRAKGSHKVKKAAQLWIFAEPP